MTAIGHAWSQMAPAARAPWQLLANQMTHKTGLRTPGGAKQTRPLSAFQAFGSLNGTRLACGQSLTLTAPEFPARPLPLPPLTLTATAKSSPHAPGALPFTLLLSAPAHAQTIQIYAAPPLLIGQYPSLPRPIIIATLPHLPSGPTDLAPAYAARFGPLAPGHQVVLKIVPVTPDGLKGTPLLLSANVVAPAQSAPRPRDTTRALKAASRAPFLISPLGPPPRSREERSLHPGKGETHLPVPSGIIPPCPNSSSSTATACSTAASSPCATCPRRPDAHQRRLLLRAHAADHLGARTARPHLRGL